MPPDRRRVEAVTALIRLGWSPPPPNREQSLRMLDDMARTHGGPTLALTPAELRLLRCLANGETVAQVARRREVSVEALKEQSKSIRRKLGVSTITRAVALVVDAGLVEVEH
jgi:DNA-binding CsgD family transcriptional regulator